VSPKTRLDAAVRIREVAEDQARLTLAEAQRVARAAQAAVRLAAEKARADERCTGSAADWTLVESAHLRALQEARQAERDEQTAVEKLGASRAHYVGAHLRAEALRKVVDTRLAELAVADRSTERRNMDEIAVVLRGRRFA
jgi:flagellar biosynthesis chaperone FliJ